MNLALVAPDCNKTDGQARYVSEMAERMAERGHHVTVYSVGFADTDPARVHHRRVVAPRDATRLRFAAFLWLASRAVADDSHDLIHSLGASCLRPDVVTFQFCQAAWRESLATRPNLSPSERGIVPALFGRGIIAAERLVAGRARATIAVSKRTAIDVATACDIDPPLVIPNGVDLERFHPHQRRHRLAVRSELELNDNAVPLALFVGEFARKNLDTAIHALSLTKRPVVLAAVGGSDPTPHHALARQLGVADRVRFLPHTPRIERLVAAADAFLFPTIYEPFGMAPLEAAATATPVIVSDRCGFAEWIEDGVDGYVVRDPDDAGAIAVLLDRLLGDPEAARKVGANGRILAEGFGWDTIATETEAVYRSAVRPAVR